MIELDDNIVLNDGKKIGTIRLIYDVKHWWVRFVPNGISPKDNNKCVTMQTPNALMNHLHTIFKTD